MLRVGPECLLRLQGKAVQSGGITRRDRFRGMDIFRENPPRSLAQRRVVSRKTVGGCIDPCKPVRPSCVQDEVARYDPLPLKTSAPSGLYPACHRRQPLKASSRLNYLADFTGKFCPEVAEGMGF